MYVSLIVKRLKIQGAVVRQAHSDVFLPGFFLYSNFTIFLPPYDKHCFVRAWRSSLKYVFELWK